MNEKPSGRFFVSTAKKLVITLMYLGIVAFFFYLPLLVNCCGTHKTLNVCAFTETFSPEAIARFEQKTGIKVNLTYVELDEQIYAKFKINKGEGYDVINVSDFMVQMLQSQGLLHALDPAKVPCMEHINKMLLNQRYDQGNSYSVPHKWFMYGIIYDKKFFNISPEDVSLDLVFTKPSDIVNQGLAKIPYKICMLDSPIDSFFLASLYLFGHDHQLSDAVYDQVARLLVTQKKWVECYTLYTVEYFLLADIVPLAITSSNFANKVVRYDNRFQFVIPREGGILVIENLVIPKRSKNKELAYQFIDFMLSEEIARLNSSTYGWTSAHEKVAHITIEEDLKQRLYIPLFDASARARIEDVWLEVECA
ncbi:MAG: spermidine/putrescine ABC transporter substrate-binding protein [Candidatus Babeliales bacterium]|jgi:spermidine/putrescine transport system substrate-binding protein